MSKCNIAIFGRGLSLFKRLRRRFRPSAIAIPCHAAHAGIQEGAGANDSELAAGNSGSPRSLGYRLRFGPAEPLRLNMAGERKADDAWPANSDKRLVRSRGAVYLTFGLTGGERWRNPRV